MVYDFYSARIGTAQQNIAVLSRVLDGSWNSTDLFELMILMRTQGGMKQSEQLLLMERARARTLNEGDRKELGFLISQEHAALAHAQERHQRDVRLGIKY